MEPSAINTTGPFSFTAEETVVHELIDQAKSKLRDYDQVLQRTRDDETRSFYLRAYADVAGILDDLEHAPMHNPQERTVQVEDTNTLHVLNLLIVMRKDPQLNSSMFAQSVFSVAKATGFQENRILPS